MAEMSKWKKLMVSLNENDSEDHNYTDHEVSMARSQLLSVVKSATNIAKNLKDRNEDEGLEGWVASKLTMAEDYLQAVSDHMNGQALEEGKPIKLRGFGPDHKKASGSSLKKIAGMKEAELDEGYKVMPPMDPKYVERKGLEGPFTTLSGKVVYYDPKEGSYYDPDTDMYMTYDEFQNYDNDYSGMKDVKEAGGYYTQPVYDMIKQHGIEKVMHELLTSLDADVIQDFMSRADLDEVNEGIPKDTSYGVAVDGKYIAKGNKANMRRLAKNTEGGQLMNSPSKKVGDSVGKAVEEEKTRLDPKCWDNKKIGDPKTKMKNGVRVNNCVPK